MVKCISCRQGYHNECIPPCECSHEVDNLEVEEDIHDDTDVRPSLRHGSTSVRRNKRDAALSDQQSTGRKRAAKLYPLDRNANCEWRGKIDCGGGAHPIIGCRDGLQQCRHHGPDKNTLNNEPQNVHRICHGCHNRWHAANDPDYQIGQLKAD